MVHTAPHFSPTRPPENDSKGIVAIFQPLTVVNFVVGDFKALSSSCNDVVYFLL